MLALSISSVGVAAWTAAGLDAPQDVDADELERRASDEAWLGATAYAS